MEIIDLVPSPDLNCSPAELPAPPGTKVNLHGVILHETQGGLIVLNVRWRNKVYSGALIDAEKNKWATDRITTSDGHPINDDNKQFQAPPPIKKIRIPTNSANTTPAEDSDSGNNKKKPVVSPTTPSKNVKGPRGNGKKRGTQESSPTRSEDIAPAKKSKGRLMYNGEHLYECLEPNCEKKYKNKNGLSYHLRTMHPTKVESCDDSGKENKSDSRDESDSGDDNFVIDEKVDDESKDGDSEDKCNAVEEQNGSQSDEGEDEKKEELTENEKQIDRLKIEAEKVQAVLSNMKQKVESADEIKKEDDPIPDEAKPILGVMEKKSIKTEGVYDNDSADKKFESNDGETTEPLVDVESDSLSSYQWKGEGKGGQASTTIASSVKEGQTSVPMITVEPSPTDEELNSDDKGEHPKGSSRTIIHEDHMSSLNELFAPTQTFHQYSPTLTSLNPQKINESLTDALSKQTSAPSMSTVTSAQSKMENPESVKESLAAKPSVEITRNEPTAATSPENRIPVDILKNSEFGRSSNDYVACSDEERSISPENALAGCHKTFPQEERDVKTTKSELLSISSMYINPLLQTMLEQNILGQAHLLGRSQRAFEKGLLFKELGSKCSIAASNMNSFQNKPPNSIPTNSNMMLQDITQVTNSDPKTLSSNSLSNSSNSSSDAKSTLPYESAPQVREYPLKPSLLEQRLLAHTAPVKSDASGTINTSLDNRAYLQINSFDNASQNREFPLKPSLLEQRLLAETIKTETSSTVSVTSGSKMFLQPSISVGIPLTRTGNKSDEIEKNDSNEKLPITSSFTVNRDLSAEKTKPTPTSLRINPPTSSMEERVQIGTHTWFPEVVNDANSSFSTPDYYNTPPIVSSSFRIPVTKSYPSYSAQSSVNSSSELKNPKNIAKRAMQPVPIAPAPAPVMQVARSEFSAPSAEYVSSPNGDKEQPQMSRFTLTSDKRLIPSPAENRGRPRKVRVEKTKQIPIGTAQDIAKVRGPTETSLPRKPSSSPVVRTSVIQGSLHPGLDGSPKPTDRNPEGHMMFPQSRDMRTFDVPADERERYGVHEKDLKPPMDIRNNEKYQGIGSPPGMYYSPTVGRGLLSPPLPRSASHSPRSADVLSRPVDVLTRPGDPMPRSSPGGHPDMFNSKAQFQMALERIEKYNSANNPGPDHARNILEHARRKPEVLRTMSDSHHDNRKHPLSPLSETLHVMQAYARAHELERDQRMAEYLGGSGRYQPPPGHRGDFGQGRADGPRSMFDHRISPEESEQARLLASRERYMQQQNPLSNRPSVYRGSPPSHTTPQPGHHSANLVLGTADGSIIGPLSSYENRPPEHKR